MEDDVQLEGRLEKILWVFRELGGWRFVGRAVIYLPLMGIVLIAGLIHAFIDWMVE